MTQLARKDLENEVGINKQLWLRRVFFFFRLEYGDFVSGRVRDEQASFEGPSVHGTEQLEQENSPTVVPHTESGKNKPTQQ